MIGVEGARRLGFAIENMPDPNAPKKQDDDYLTKELAKFQQDPQAATKLISVGESPRPSGVDASELAAWTAVGNVLLNLDETITKG